ncbi:unnamed protein product, partial [Mesorhabditis belari]|uniref:DUF229 domain containing protein n=1 Tax=Mesorhabditis belari TaxID=2138241 RepID=A0AAF3FT14_9BILA
MRLTRSCTSVAKVFLVVSLLSTIYKFWGKKQEILGKLLLIEVKTISSPKPASTTHMLENSCKFPTISSADESLKKYIKLNKTQKACPNPYLQVMTKDEMGNFYFAESKEITKNSMQCYMSELGGALRPKALRFTKNGRFLLPKNDWFWVNADNFLITCYGNANLSTIFRRQFMGVTDTTVQRKVVPGKRPLPNPRQFDLSSLSISMLVLDSTSRTQFLRHAPKTVKKMNDMEFVILNGYNKVGDNSNVNLLPIIAHQLAVTKSYPLLTKDGQIELAKILPINASIDPDTIDFIWKEMKARGCETLFNDDIMHRSRGILHYPAKYFLPGFSRPPADHYYRPFYTNFYTETENHWKICYEGRQMPEEFADPWFHFTRFTADRYAFGFNFITSMTHDDPNNLQVIDEYLAKRLELLDNADALENTVLLIMGDHGQRLNGATQTFAGRIEERTPLMAIYLPKRLRELFPEESQTLLDNSNRFTSNFDVHEMLLDFIEGKIGDKRKRRDDARGTSLFLPIPSTRSCLENNVVEVFCLCQPEISQQLIKDMKRKVKYTFGFIEAHCSMKTTRDEKLSILFRLKHRFNSNEFSITIPPLIRDSQNVTLFGLNFCF